MLSETKSRSFSGKRICLLIYATFCILNSSFAQGTWTWISGSNNANSTGVFGTQGIPSINNHPPGIYEGAEWKDKQGNFWVFGGWAPGTQEAYSDLWKYNPVTNEWTWVKGNKLLNLSPVYGTKGVAAPTNTPAGRILASASWIDTTGSLWLFGGAGKNNLWQYDIGTNNWTWMSGDSDILLGVYGIQGVPSVSNVPGAGFETCSAWTDSLNNLWLFGGSGPDSSGYNGYLNDLWKYDIATNEWTWMKGSAFVKDRGNYGIKGIANASNEPGARLSYTKWKDTQGDFWLMGGLLTFGDSTVSDVWKYDMKSNEWTWMYGPETPDDSGNYEHTCVFDTSNRPASRFEQRSSVTDNCGRFWLFGGVSYYNISGILLNDLWVFDPQQLKWEWLSGTNSNQRGNYGTKGVASPANMPPSREGALAWWGNDNKFYMFGGGASSGQFSDLWVFNPDTNCVPLCNTPAIAGFQSAQTNICANDCINFTDQSVNATSWQWSFAGAIDSTSTMQNPQDVCYPKAGVYNVTLVASNTGGSAWVTLSNYITVYPVPPAPVISQLYDTLLSFNSNPNYASIQWYIDSTLIQGATGTSLIIHQGGNYNVRIENGHGCSVAAGINVVGIKEISQDSYISLSPNPVDKQFTIHDSQFTIKEVEIYNVLGQIVTSSSPLQRQGEDVVIEVGTLASGVYFVQTYDGTQRFVSKFVKE